MMMHGLLLGITAITVLCYWAMIWSIDAKRPFLGVLWATIMSGGVVSFVYTVRSIAQ